MVILTLSTYHKQNDYCMKRIDDKNKDDQFHKLIFTFLQKSLESSIISYFSGSNGC